MPTLLLNLRNGALLASLATIPVLVGFVWNALVGEEIGATPRALGVILFAWIAAAAAVAAFSSSAARDGNKLDWFYPCTNCKQRVAIFSYRCTHCKTRFVPPPEAIAFRNTLIAGLAVFYAIFLIGGILMRL